jgi:hypothetical protein
MPVTDKPTCTRCGQPTDAAACHRCARDLTQALTEAAGHAEDAWTVLARQTRYGTAGGARKVEPEPAGADIDLRRNRVTEFGWAASLERPPVGALRAGPIPPDLKAGRTLDDVGDVATYWAGWICQTRTVELSARRPLHAPLCDRGFECTHPSCMGIRFRRPPSVLAEALGWLATQTGWLRTRPEAAEAFDELADACRLLVLLVDRPTDQVLVGMCDCGRTLYALAHRHTVTCKPCALTWDVERSRQILRRHLDDQLMTAAEAAALVVVEDQGGRTIEQIRRLIGMWAARGQIGARGQVWREPNTGELERDPNRGPVAVPTYRFGDVADRLARTPRRNREGAAA